MGTVTTGALCNSIEDTLKTATGILKSQSYDELTEGYDDLPLLRVYPKSAEIISAGTDRGAFRGGVRQTDILFYADIICRQRSVLDEDYAKCLDVEAAVTTVLEAQKTKPYFGNEHIQAFQWNWEILEFQLGAGEGTISFIGIRFSISVTVF